MTTGNSIQIDPDELAKVVEGSASGKAIVLRKGIIVNPNTISNIVEDTERRAMFLDKVRYDAPRREKGMEPLKNIFKDMKLTASSGVKLIQKP